MADNVHEGDLDLSDYPEGNLDGWFDTVEKFLENDFLDQRGVLKDGYFGKYILLHIDENDFREGRYSNFSNVSAVWRAGRGTPTEFKDALSGTISKEAIDNDLKDPPGEDEVVVLLYTRSWQPITSYSKRSDQFPYDCDECLETLTYAETIQVDPNDAWIRCCPDCSSERNVNQPELETNVHEGDLDLSDVTSPEGLELPDKVTGNLNLWSLTSAEGLKLPAHVGEHLWLFKLVSAEGLELPKHVGGTLNLNGLTSAEGLKLPEHMEGGLTLNRLTSAEGLKLPAHVGGTLELTGLTSAEGLKLPEHVGGDLWLTGLTSAEGLKLPEHVGEDLHLWELDEDEYDQKIHGPRELGGEVHFSDPDDD